MMYSDVSIYGLIRCRELIFLYRVFYTSPSVLFSNEMEKKGKPANQIWCSIKF